MVKSSRASAFVNPETLARLAPDSLEELLRPYRPELDTIAPLLAGQVPAASINAVLASHAGSLPSALIHELHVIEELGVSNNLDRVRETAVHTGLDVTGHATCADLLVLLLRHNPSAVERLLAERAWTARRKFYSFLGLEDSPTPPRLDDDVLDALGTSLNEHMAGRGVGLGLRVHLSPRSGGFALLFRHGDALHREAAVQEASHATEHLAYHPERYDVAFYDAAEKELLINARRPRSLMVYAQHIGKHIFGNTRLFDGGGLPLRYTLEPLRANPGGCLLTGDVPELVGARLVQLEWQSAWPGVDRATFHGSDLVQGLGDFLPFHARLTMVTFKLKFRDGHESSVSIWLPNQAVFGRESDIAVVRRWLALRGFVCAREEATGGLNAPLLAVP